MNAKQFRVTSIFSAIAASLVLSGCAGSGGAFSPTTVSGGTPVPITVTISPSNPTLPLGGTQLFTAAITGTTNTAVTWSVSSSDGTTNPGSITSGGLYSAPNNVPSFHGPTKGNSLVQGHPFGNVSATFTITAASAANPDITGTTSVTVTNEGG